MPADNTTLKLPAIYSIEESHGGNLIQQLLVTEQDIEVTHEEYVDEHVRCTIARPVNSPDTRILILPDGAVIPDGFDHVLVERKTRRKGAHDARTFEWLRHPRRVDIPLAPIDYDAHCRGVLSSWKGAFSYLPEDEEAGIKGLRTPQVGAVHAVHGHWATSKQAATIVMPTGTGKTETMLSILVSKCCSKVLVVVPTDALRTQIAGKFLTFGVLKEFGVIGERAHYPVVGVLKHRPKTQEEVDEFFSRCSVVVTTATIAGQCLDEVQKRMAHWCDYLFIDEAHHIGAPSWYTFRENFTPNHILQFTATPFRNDGKLIPGKIIFNFPLRLALEQGYFRKINFLPVEEYDRRRADEAIAERAVEKLRADLEQFDHVLMARVDSIDRAEEVYEIYRRYEDLNPVRIHTGLKPREREEIRRKILSREARIIVCVDMLGEGFDLPELKIAAFHDVKKSLPITLQLAGRFTRSKPHLGDPAFIANTGTIEYYNELRKLYTQDSDWNTLLTGASEEIIEDQISFQEFLEGFGNLPEDIPLHNMRPALSTVIYRTSCEDWDPENFREGLPGLENIERVQHRINHEKKTMVIVTARKVRVDWAQVQEIFNWDWELYVIHWDDTQKLLFINCSGNDGHYQKLASAIAGDTVELIKGRPVFRCFAGVNRLKLQNVGLQERLGKLIKYIMRAGGDVEAGLTEAQKRNAAKSNIFGNGYESGRKTSVGCSYKGRIWSQRVANVESLVRWCRFIGHKVLDETIDPDEVLKGTLVPTVVSQRPDKMPIGIEWPEVIYREPENAFHIVLGEELTLPLYNFDLRLTRPSTEGDITFELFTEGIAVPFTLSLFERDETKDYRFTATGGPPVYIRRGSWRVPLAEFFYKESPTIWFANGSSLEGNLLTELKKEYPPYVAERIEAWDWSGINIKKESQKIEKRKDSVQYHVIQQLLTRDYEIVIDDDDPGEAADVVAIKVEERHIIIDLFHCKFSSEEKPGGRVGDLYEVCGQAQKSIRWVERIPDLFQHLLRRHKQREGRGLGRLEKGSTEDLQRLRERSIVSPVTLRVHIVQPGLSKKEASLEQLELLSVTENYLMETYKLPFTVIANS